MINLIYLKLFYDSALMGNVTESARPNFVSQPAVSQAIAKLEKALKVSLCIHKKLQFKLTEEGEIVLKYAREIFAGVQKRLANREELSNWELIARVLKKGRGYGLLPDLIGNKSHLIRIPESYSKLPQASGLLSEEPQQFLYIVVYYFVVFGLLS